MNIKLTQDALAEPFLIHRDDCSAYYIFTLTLETSTCHVLSRMSQNSKTLKSVDYRRLKMLKCGKNMVTSRGGQGVSEQPTHGGEILENIQTSHSRKNKLVATNTSDMPVASQMPKRWWYTCGAKQERSRCSEKVRRQQKPSAFLI